MKTLVLGVYEAIVGQNLFDISSIIGALNRGIELANEGYTQVAAKAVSDLAETGSDQVISILEVVSDEQK